MLVVVYDLLSAGTVLELATGLCDLMATLCCQSEEWIHGYFDMRAVGAHGRRIVDWYCGHK